LCRRLRITYNWGSSSIARFFHVLEELREGDSPAELYQYVIIFQRIRFDRSSTFFGTVV
jgi:hypothetical protein